MQDISGEVTIESLIRKALDRLKVGDAEDSIALFEDALRLDCEDREILYALRCVNWWLEKFAGLEGITAPYDKGYFIMGQWGAFYEFLDTIGPHFDRCRYAVRYFVYGAALESFEPALAEGMRHDPGLLLRIGRCYKGVGNYDTALEYLQKAAHFRQEDGAALAELADVNALLDDAKSAKVLFREAFFVDPQGVELYALESEMINSLIEMVKNTGISGRALVEWIPVYGTLLGVFSVKRELKLVEVGKLKQAIFALENEVRGNSGDNAILVPQLLNRYLWLLDHYESINEEAAVINEVLLKIKLIDPMIYDRYMSVK
jgi:tetratricopeptide (TPR) repeat protein